MEVGILAGGYGTRVAEETEIRPKPMVESLRAFEEHYYGKVRNCEHLLGTYSESGFAVWGAGSKGVSFVNLVPNGKSANCIVDISPNKQNRYIPDTRHQVMSPADLVDARIEHVIIMNPNYTEEISRTFSEHSIHAKVHAA